MGACNSTKPDADKKVQGPPIEKQPEHQPIVQPPFTKAIVSEEKMKEILLHFTYNEKVLFESVFAPSTTFTKLIEYIDEKFVKRPTRRYEYLFCFGKALVDLHNNKNTTIQKLLTQKTKENEIEKDDEFNVAIRLVGLDFCDNFRSQVASYSLIGKPIEESDPFEVVVYDKELKSLYSVQYDLPQDKKELALFSNYSAYCNGRNKLFVSGGERSKTAVLDDQAKNKTYLQFFYCLDLKTGHLEKLKDMSMPRSWHSMIFIPDNLIFFIGGVESKSVEHYDLSKNAFFKEPDLLEARCEPSLCLLNNEFIYAFYNYSIQMQNYSETIERCNLKNKNRQWEFVDLSPNSIKLTSRFFGVSLLNDTQAIILGGVDMKKDHNDINEQNMYNYQDTIYLYDFTSNEIRVHTEHFKFEYLLGGDKFLHPIDEKRLIIFPLNDQHMGLIYSEGSIEQVEYNERENKHFEQVLDISKDKVTNTSYVG